MGLIEQAQAGDREALAALLTQEATYLEKTAWLYLGDAQEVQDAIADTTLEALHGITSLKQAAYFRTWLTKLLLRQCYRRYARRGPTVVDIAELPALPTTASVSSDQKLDLLAGMRRLNDANRQALLMYYYHGLSVAEIAMVTGLSTNTIKSQLARGRRQLRAWLGDDFLER